MALIAFRVVEGGRRLVLDRVKGIISPDGLRTVGALAVLYCDLDSKPTSREVPAGHDGLWLLVLCVVHVHDQHGPVWELAGFPVCGIGFRIEVNMMKFADARFLTTDLFAGRHLRQILTVLQAEIGSNEHP